ncbi:IS4 family transposase [Chloroflexota bacterium]
MTDRHKVYTKVVKTLKQMMEMDHQGHLVTLAMMITGIVIGRNAQLSAMSTEVPVSVKEKSIEMRLRRWVKHSKIEVEAVYMPFAQQILQALASNPLVLVMDGSQIGRGCMVLMVGVLYKKRALPIAWIVCRGKKGHTTAQRHIRALEKVLPLLPAESEVVLLGDAEYDTTEMLIWLQENTTWHYVLRTSPQIYVLDAQESQPISEYPLAKGQVFHRHNVGFTQTAAVTLNLVGWWGSRYEEPIFLVTNLSNAYQACRYYRRRYRIETFFSDQKSRGFHIHKSHLSDPIRLSRLLIAACLAYIWMISQGLWVIATKKTALIDRTDRVDKSIFRLGLDWLKYALKRNIDFEPVFCFQPIETVGNVR